jgi:hypothetical protein
MNVQASFINFEYPQGSGPSNSQSFAINYENLTNGIQINTISPITPLEFSLDGIGWSASLDTTNAYFGTGTLIAYARLKSDLSTNIYNGQFYVSFPQDGDAIPINYYAAVKVPQNNVTIAGVYAPLRTFFGYPSASGQYVSNPQEIEVYIESASFTSMSISITSSYELCVDRSVTSPLFFTSSISESIITASGITNDYSLKFWMRVRSGSAGSIDTTLAVRDQNNNTVATASISGKRYTSLSSIDCWNEAITIDVLWRNIGTNGITTYSFEKHIYFNNIIGEFSQYISDGFIDINEYDEYYRRAITNNQISHIRLVTPIQRLAFKSYSTSSFTLYPEVNPTVAFWLDSNRVPTTPEFVRIQFQIMEPELILSFFLNSNLSSLINSPVSITGLHKLPYLNYFQYRGSQSSTADIQSLKYLGDIYGSVTITDTLGFLDSIKLPNRVGRTVINALRGGKRNLYYYPNVYSKLNSRANIRPQLNTVYEERNYLNDRMINNIQSEGFIDSNTIRITVDSIPLPEISDLSIYTSLQDLTLVNLTGSLTTLYLPQNLTNLSLSGSPINYTINQESSYIGRLNRFNIGQSGSTNILNYDSFINNLRFTTSSQSTLTGITTSSLPAIPSTITASVVGGGTFEDFNFRTIYTSGEPTMSIATINGTGMLYTPGMTINFDPSVSDLKSVTVTNMTSSYDVDLSNLVSASVSITSGVRNVTLPQSYYGSNQTFTINSINFENVYITSSADYSMSNTASLGIIPGFLIDTLDLSGSFISNLTVSSSGYFNSFRRLLGGFETIRNYNLQFSSFDAGGVEYLLSQIETLGPTTGIRTIDLRNQKNGLYISPAISASKATLEGLGWTVNI